MEKGERKLGGRRDCKTASLLLSLSFPTLCCLSKIGSWEEEGGGMNVAGGGEWQPPHPNALDTGSN